MESYLHDPKKLDAYFITHKANPSDLDIFIREKIPVPPTWVIMVNLDDTDAFMRRIIDTKPPIYTILYLVHRGWKGKVGDVLMLLDQYPASIPREDAYYLLLRRIKSASGYTIDESDILEGSTSPNVKCRLDALYKLRKVSAEDHSFIL